TWTDVGDLQFSRCYDLKVLDEDGAGPMPTSVYAVLRNSAGTYQLFRLAGTQWTPIAPMRSGYTDLTVFDADGDGPLPSFIYRSGTIYPFVEKWDGTSWSAVDGTIDAG